MCVYLWVGRRGPVGVPGVGAVDAGGVRDGGADVDAAEAAFLRSGGTLALRLPAPCRRQGAFQTQSCT